MSIPLQAGPDSPVVGTIEPLEDGARSHVSIALDLQGHGIGKLLLPLVDRRNVQQEMPRNMQKLKERLEGDSSDTS